MPSWMVRLAVSRAIDVRRYAFNMRRHVLAMVMMPTRGWYTSWAIEAVKALGFVTQADLRIDHFPGERRIADRMGRRTLDEHSPFWAACHDLPRVAG